MGEIRRMLVSWLLGGVVVLGLLYLLDLSWRMERPAVDEPPAPAARSVAPPEPIMVPPPMVRDRAVPKASPKVDADESRRKAQLAALQKRRETCEYWTRENTRGQYNGLQTTACNDWRNLAAQLGVSTSPVPARRGSAGGGASVMPQAAPQPRTTAVLVNHCSQFTDGSIQYRQCRWTEKKRLESACSRYEWEANNRRGSQGDIARAKAWA